MKFFALIVLQILSLSIHSANATKRYFSFDPNPYRVWVILETPYGIEDSRITTIECECYDQCQTTEELFYYVISTDGRPQRDAIVRLNTQDFICTVHNDIGHLYNNDDNLFKTIPLTVMEDDHVNVSTSIDCTAMCSYYWIKDNKVVSESNNLLQRPITREDHGVYTWFAIADSEEHPVTGLFKLVVYYRPTELDIHASSRPTAFAPGDNLNLTCTAPSNPPCSKRWIFENKIISHSAMLQLKNISAKDGGSYVCEVTYPVDGVVNQTSFSLNISYGPNTIKVYPPNPIIVVKGKDVTAICSSDCRGECVYTWTNNSVVLGNHSSLLIKFVHSRPSFLMCTVKNSVTKQVMVWILNVTYIYGPENIHLSKKNPGMILYNADLDLWCYVTCFPCDVHWTRNGTVISKSTHLHVKYSQVVNNGDIYTCWAKNSVTMLSTQVGFKTKHVYGPVNLKLHVTDRHWVTLVRCSFDCYPPCSVYWTFVNSNRHITSSSLLIMSKDIYFDVDLTPEEEKEAGDFQIYPIENGYICVGTNTATGVFTMRTVRF